jgi:hypothetical protein
VRTQKQPPNRVGREPAQIVTLREAEEAHPGQWVLFKITAMDRGHATSNGEVVYHHKDQRLVSRALERLRESEPDAHVAVFLGGHRFEDIDQWRHFLDTLPWEQYVNARW